MGDNPRMKPPTIAERMAAGPSREVKKRKNLTYAQKLEICKLIGGGETKRSVAKKYDVNESTVRGIYNKKEHIKKHMSLAPSVAASDAKRSGNQLLLKTEQLLSRYMDRQAKRNLAVDTREIMDTAKEIYHGVAAKDGVVNPPVFLASRGWVDRFMARHKVKSVKVSGEAASGDKAAARAYPESLKKTIDSGQYTPDQIFNMDETNFYWKTMPRRTFITTKSTKIRGRKAIKERFTLLLAMNASGTCRLKPTVVHRAKKPRPYAGYDMKKLNVHWLTSKKGYVSAKLSLDWFNDCFVKDVETYCKNNNIRFNILLLLDNAPGHSPLLRSENPNVKVEFLPPNTTSLIQPLDQEVISVVKAAYSRRQFRMMRQATEDTTLIQHLVDSEDEGDEEKETADTESEQRVLRYWKNFKIKQAVDLVVDCWNNITPATIHHAWRNISEGLPEDRLVRVAGGEPQSADAEIEAAAAEARGIAGRGFEDTTGDEIREMLRPPPVSARDILEEDAEEADDSPGEEEEEKVNEEGLSIKGVKCLIELAGQMKHILEQDTTIDSEIRTYYINMALAGYEDKYHAHMNALHQRQITEYFRQHPESHPHPDPEHRPQPDQEPQPGASIQPEPQPGTSSQFEGFDYDGFLDDLAQQRMEVLLSEGQASEACEGGH